MFDTFSIWLEKKKSQPIVHHDLDSWLTSVDNLKKDLDKLKSVIKDKEVKKKEIKTNLKPKVNLAKPITNNNKKEEKPIDKEEDKSKKVIFKKPEEKDAEVENS